MAILTTSTTLSVGVLNEQIKQAVMPVTVFVGVEVVLAFFGNLVVLYVFLLRYPKGNFRCFVLCLTAIDLTCAITTMPGEMLTQLKWYEYPYPMICKIKSFFNVFTVSSEVFCFLTIAVDRYRRVCHPYDRQISIGLARWLCLGIFTAGFVVSLPVAFFWGAHTELVEGNFTTTVCEKDEKYRDTGKPFAYSISIEVLISVCLAIMLLLYALIARAMVLQNRRLKSHEIVKSTTQEHGIYTSNTSTPTQQAEDHTENRSSATSVSSTEMSTIRKQSKQNERLSQQSSNTIGSRTFNPKVRRKTLIMFILSVTFTVTIIIYLTLLSDIANGVLDTLSDGQKAVYFFFFRFYFINHVINPIVYGLLDPRFREIVTSCKKRVAKTGSDSATSE